VRRLLLVSRVLTSEMFGFDPCELAPPMRAHRNGANERSDTGWKPVLHCSAAARDPKRVAICSISILLVFLTVGASDTEKIKQH
jgi:hypothetical protein